MLLAWWSEAAAAVGLLSSLLVVVGLSLVMVGGYIWGLRYAPPARAGEPQVMGAPVVSHGLWLALLGHLFLFAVAANFDWAVPPWPLFGALAVVDAGVQHCRARGEERAHSFRLDRDDGRDPGGVARRDAAGRLRRNGDCGVRRADRVCPRVDRGDEALRHDRRAGRSHGDRHLRDQPDRDDGDALAGVAAGCR